MGAGSLLIGISYTILAPSSFLAPFSFVLEFVFLPWSEVCSAIVTSLLLLLLLLASAGLLCPSYFPVVSLVRKSSPAVPGAGWRWSGFRRSRIPRLPVIRPPPLTPLLSWGVLSHACVFSLGILCNVEGFVGSLLYTCYVELSPEVSSKP